MQNGLTDLPRFVKMATRGDKREDEALDKKILFHCLLSVRILLKHFRCMVVYRDLLLCQYVIVATFLITLWLLRLLTIESQIVNENYLFCYSRLIRVKVVFVGLRSLIDQRILSYCRSPL